MTFGAAELAHTSYGLKQSFASRKFGGSRHSANEFALCSRLHKLSPYSKSHWRSLPKSLMRINEAMNLLMKQ